MLNSTTSYCGTRTFSHHIFLSPILSILRYRWTDRRAAPAIFQKCPEYWLIARRTGGDNISCIIYCARVYCTHLEGRSESEKAQHRSSRVQINPILRALFYFFYFFSSLSSLLDSPRGINGANKERNHQRSPNFLDTFERKEKKTTTNLDPGACAMDYSSEAHCACLTVSHFSCERGWWEGQDSLPLQSEWTDPDIKVHFFVRQTFPLWMLS